MKNPPDKPFQIGISGSYGGMNLGDEAILSGILTQLRDSVPAEITVFSVDPEDTMRRHDVARAVPVRTLTRRESAAEVARLDLFILGGGGILYDRDAALYLRELLIAEELGIPTVVYAVSAGPLADPSARQAVRSALDAATVVSVRDKQGLRMLEDVGVDREIHLTADPALLLRPEPLPRAKIESEGVEFDRHLIGFSVREPGPAAPDIDPDEYYRLLANAADYVIERLDADVLFVPMERTDVLHSHAVVAHMNNAERAEVLRRRYTSGQVLDLVGHFEFSVGMRLHFLIFSALREIPFIALPYASKVTGFIADLAMDVPPLGAINSGQLIARLDRAWDTRHETRGMIRRALPALVARARETNRLVVELLEQRAGAAAERKVA
jgi:polysaccharide pyruvyl transferase CsaB